MNNNGSAAALAGFAAIGLFAVTQVVFLFSAVFGQINPVGGSAGELGAVNSLGMFVLAPAVASFGAALPARALGAGWMRSLLAAAAAVGTFFWAFFGDGFAMSVPVIAALAPAFVTLVGSAGSGITRAGLLAVLVGAAVFLLVALAVFPPSGNVAAVEFYAVLPAWVVLPAIAGLFQHRRGREEGHS